MFNAYKKLGARFVVLSIGYCYLLISTLPAHAVLEGCEHLLNTLRKDMSSLTRTEVIEKLDTEFFDSIVEFSECLKIGDSAGGGAAGGVQGDASASGSTASNAEEASQVATPAANVQGTEVKSPEATEDSELNSTSVAAVENPTAANLAPVSKTDDQDDPAIHGKIPEDIPPSDNDSLLAAQIRRAAIAETDPIKREKLWNEYRKYKGLPLKNNPN